MSFISRTFSCNISTHQIFKFSTLLITWLFLACLQWVSCLPLSFNFLRRFKEAPSRKKEKETSGARVGFPSSWEKVCNIINTRLNFSCFSRRVEQFSTVFSTTSSSDAYPFQHFLPFPTLSLFLTVLFNINLYCQFSLGKIFMRYKVTLLSSFC